jgi:hypothetical protein
LKWTVEGVKSFGDYRRICTRGYDKKLNMSEKTRRNTDGALTGAALFQNFKSGSGESIRPGIRHHSESRLPPPFVGNAFLVNMEALKPNRSFVHREDMTKDPRQSHYIT